MTFGYPWLVAGISEVPLEVTRLLAYVASNGREGVASPGDLQVLESATPNNYVRVMPGAFTCLNRFASQSNQSYMGYNDGAVSIAVPATTTAARNDLIWLKITDTGQSGGGTSAPVSVQIQPSVGAATRIQDVSGFGSQAGYTLAKLTIPSSTSVITQGMITDLRDLVNPRRGEEQFLVSLNTGNQVLKSAAFSVWPNAATWSVDIPPWAVKMQAVIFISGFKINEGGTGGANMTGSLQVKFGSDVSSDTLYNYSCPAGLGKIDAGASMVAGSFQIAKADRGTTKTMSLRGKRVSSNNDASCLSAGDGTTVVTQITFMEDTDQSWWS